MSTRAIAPTVGVSNYTVSKDRQVLGHLTPESEPVDLATGEVLDVERTHKEVDDPHLVDFAGSVVSVSTVAPVPGAVEPVKVVGLDGKSYTRPAPINGDCLVADVIYRRIL